MDRNRRVVVGVISDLVTDQRVHKVCLFLIEKGYDVHLIGREKKDSAPLLSTPYNAERLEVGPQKGVLMYLVFMWKLFWRTLRLPRATIYLSNDLDTLLPLFLRAKLSGSRIVYDSHELFTEVPELIHRPKKQAVWKFLEKRLVPQVDAMYTVNSAISNYYSTLYKREVAVVRNVAPKWSPTQLIPKAELGLPIDKKILIMQGAGMNIDRGIEEAIRMMHFLTGTVLILVGDGDFIPEAKRIVSDEELGEKVLFFGKRPYLELMQFTAHADLGLSLDQPTNPNYIHSLPNKIFDFIQTNTPIICTPIPAVAAIVKRYGVGCVVDDCSPEYLASVVQQVLKNDEAYTEMRLACEKAAEQETWEKECSILVQIFGKITP